MLRVPSSRVEKWLYARGWLDPSSLPLPDFLIIGPPQCGTSWLHENLSCHPDVFVPRQKQLHYFDRDFKQPLRHYARYFAQGRGKVRGEITPDYCVLRQDRIEFMHAVMPHLRLILVLRNPIDRVWSAARRIFSRRSKDFLKDVPEEEILHFFENDSYDYPGDYEPSLNRGCYGRILEKWLAVFPADQMLLIRFAELESDPRGLLTRVFSHIGATADVDWSRFPTEQRINSNPAMEIPEKFRLALDRQYADELRRFGQLYNVDSN